MSVVLFHDLTWECRSISGYDSAWIHESTDTKIGPISDDGTELVSSAVDEFVFYHDSDTRVIVSEIGDLGSSADIDMIADHRVSEIG